MEQNINCLTKLIKVVFWCKKISRNISILNLQNVPVPEKEIAVTGEDVTGRGVESENTENEVGIATENATAIVTGIGKGIAIARGSVITRNIRDRVAEKGKGSAIANIAKEAGRTGKIGNKIYRSN